MGFRSPGTPRPGFCDYLIAFLTVIGTGLVAGVCYTLIKRYCE